MRKLPFRDPFKDWTAEQFREQERISLEKARRHDRSSALHFTHAAQWRQRAEELETSK